MYLRTLRSGENSQGQTMYLRTLRSTQKSMQTGDRNAGRLSGSSLTRRNLEGKGAESSVVRYSIGKRTVHNPVEGDPNVRDNPTGAVRRVARTGGIV